MRGLLRLIGLKARPPTLTDFDVERQVFLCIFLPSFLDAGSSLQSLSRN